MLPLPEGLPHFLVGEEVRKIVGGDHKTTTDGTPYTFCLPVTTLRIFKARLEGAWAQTYRKIVRVSKDDIEVEDVPSTGVVMCDGLGDLTNGGVACVIRYGTLTRNNKYWRIGDTLSSAETAWNVFLGHAAFNKLAHQLYDLGPYDLYSSVCVSDEGKAITKGIELYLLLSKVTFKEALTTNWREVSAMVQEIHDKELQHEESQDEELQLDDHKLQGDAPWTGPAGFKNGTQEQSMECLFYQCSATNSASVYSRDRL